MSTYKDLLNERIALNQRIEEVRQNEIKVAVQSARELVAEFELTEQDVFGGTRRTNKKSGKPVEAKYCDPVTGKTWTGRGKAPLWSADKNRDDFLIPAA